jgi:hypothetical protein
MSIPVGAWATMGDHADVAQLVERDLAKVEVAGSSPVVRSRKFTVSCLRGRKYVPGAPVVERRRLVFLAIEMMRVVKGL